MFKEAKNEMQWQEHLKLISDAASVSLAIFFHDVIYDPKAGSPQHLGTFSRYIQFHFSLESDIRTKSRGCRLSVSTHDERFEVVHLKLELLPVQ
jgi:predicted metal-dependent HD superfamily phosphohydrolase